MTALKRAKTAYAANHRTIGIPKTTEYDAIARVTHDIKIADANKQADYSSFVAALHENRKLWDFFGVSVADERNALPAPLRAQIFYLAEFTQHYTRQVLKEGADVSALIEINTSILSGLSGNKVKT